MSSPQPKIVILLATRNGAEFLAEQLDSYRAQTYRNWELLVSDDGSTDNTIDIINDFAKTIPQRVVVRPGPRLGFWQNFMALAHTSDTDADLFAYSDQDDIWFAEKLAKAAAWFEGRSVAKPALYFTRTELVEADGRSVGFSPPCTRPPTFQNALVQNIGGGNTMVFNRAARTVLQTTPADAVLISHDWWTYQVVTGVGGSTHYDVWPSLKYRQHGQNLVGSNIGLGARLVRMKAFAGGRVVMWNQANIAALAKMQAVLTSENVSTLDRFARARRASLVARLYLLWSSGVYRQSKIENVGLYIGCLFGRL